MSSLDFNPDSLFAEGGRLPAIKSWLTDTVWTLARYQQHEPENYLRSGEEAVCRLEELIATGASSVWDELQAESFQAPKLKSWLGLDAALPLNAPRAAVVFDGLSLREMPLLLRMAEVSGFRVKLMQAVATCLPTETIYFVDQRLIGARIGPSQLPGRTELAQKNVEAAYLEQPTSRHNATDGRGVLLWSTYPGRRAQARANSTSTADSRSWKSSSRGLNSNQDHEKENRHTLGRGRLSKVEGNGGPREALSQ